MRTKIENLIADLNTKHYNNQIEIEQIFKNNDIDYESDNCDEELFDVADTSDIVRYEELETINSEIVDFIYSLEQILEREVK